MNILEDILWNIAGFAFLTNVLPICIILLLLLILYLYSLYKLDGYSTRFSFNEALNKKMLFYPSQHRMVYLKFYMNLLCPFFTISAMATCALAEVYSSLSILHLAILLLCAFNMVAVRSIRPFGFYSTLLSLFIISAFNIVNACVDLIAGTLPWPFLILSALSIPLYTTFGIATFIYYTKRKPLFFKSLEQLKAESLNSDPDREMEEMGEVWM